MPASLEWRREDYRKRRQRALDYLGGKCVRCGATEDLQFDHKEPGSREFVVSTRLTRSFDSIKSELDKCQLLCRDHHLEKSREHGEQLPASDHGGSNKRRSCRCHVCITSRSAYNKEWKKRTGYNWRAIRPDACT